MRGVKAIVAQFYISRDLDDYLKDHRQSVNVLTACKKTVNCLNNCYDMKGKIQPERNISKPSFETVKFGYSQCAKYQ